MPRRSDRVLRSAARIALVVGVLVVLLVGLVLVMGAGAQETGTDVATRVVDVRYQEPDETIASPIVDALAPSTVLTVRASGFASDTTGRVVQCAVGDRRLCGESLPVRFDEHGAATFQILVTDMIGTRLDAESPCRIASTARCTVDILVGSNRTVIDTVFIDEAPRAGRLSIEADGDLEVGSTVILRATQFPPGVELRVRVCAAPAVRGDRCGAPGPDVDLVTDAQGAATVPLRLEVSDVGADGIACGRRTACHVVVDSDAVGVWARPALLAFAGEAGADYDSGRLAVGLATAAALVIAAAWLVRSTDWRPPAEADGSLIDDAAFADLDAEAERFEDVWR